ncbi:MAG TPA: GGDEF domain-containing protein [Ruminococcus sp.]|nr:GGDEF domain-containing protein [Ruminococcus sp.]
MQKKRISTVTLILIFQIITMAILTSIITETVSSKTRQNSLDHMKTITDERAQIIESYVQNAEKTLSSYARAGQITELLADPTNRDKQTAAQEYTERFSGDIVQLEGIYVSEWNTHVLAHTSKAAVGITTRKGDKLKQLQDAMLSKGDGVYNTGIIISPASYKQIVSMYKAVYDKNGNPIGLVGMGVYTDGLINTLDNLTIRGLGKDTTSYSMVNIADKKYIFNRDKELVSTVTTNEELLTLCDNLSDPEFTGNETDSYIYEMDGTKYVSTYTYMKDYGWILTLDAPKNEVYKLTNSMYVFFSIFTVLLFGLILFFHFINKRQEATNRKLSSQIMKTEKTKQSLTTAMFKDILTEVGNRSSFTMDVGKLEPVEDKSYYFVLFNISDFSEINVKFGNEIGDEILISTVETLRKNFPNSDIYRTGSDEFVVVTLEDSSNVGFSNVINNVNIAHAALLTPHDTVNGTVNAEYKIACAKKSKVFRSSIVATLKDMTNRTGTAVFGQVQFIDLDLQAKE